MITAEFKQSFVADGSYSVLALAGKTYYFVTISEGNKFTSWSGMSDDISDLKTAESTSHKLGSGDLSDYWPEELDELDFLSDEWQEYVDDMVLVLVNKLEQKKTKESRKKQPVKTKDQANPLLGKFAVILEKGMFAQVGEKSGGPFGHWSNPAKNSTKEDMTRAWKRWTESHDLGYSTNVTMNESQAIACYGDIDSCLKDLKKRGFEVLVYVSAREDKEGFDAIISEEDLWKEYFKESKKYSYLGMECILEKLITK